MSESALNWLPQCLNINANYYNALQEHCNIHVILVST
jgi:hypothetical protein